MGYSSIADWVKNPNHVYVGRNLDRYINGDNPRQMRRSWGNPFLLSQYTRRKSLKKYKKYVKKNLMSHLPELTDKVLGCWCHPLPCHAHVLKELHKEMCLKDRQ
jgi:hypothetical protein